MGEFDNLLASLSAIGADSLLHLPGVDDPITASSYLSRALSLMQERAIPFEQAWSSAINRIQAPQRDGVSDPRLAQLVSEERALLEEDRPKWRAAYERRPVTTRERAVCTVAAWRRLEAGTSVARSKRAA